MTLSNLFTAIKSHISNNDSELALRRLLDAAYDTGNLAVIQDTVQVSKLVRPKILEDSTMVKDLLLQATEQVALASEGYEEIEESAVLISINNIQKTYKTGRFSLDTLSLQIRAGEVLGVVGENGNGKTTMLRIIAGELMSDEGTIDYSVFPNADNYGVKQKLSFIPQRIPRWYGGLKDNLHFTAAIAGNSEEENKVMVEFMLERFNLSSYADLTWDKISSGYRTRFEIARVLLQNPKILILDEPLANLDIKAQQTLLTDLIFLAKGRRRNMAVLLSSQQLHEVEKVADSVLFLKNGKSVMNNALSPSNNSFMIEVELVGEMQALQDSLATEDMQVSFNGGFYSITSNTINANQMLQVLINKGWGINYYRDITNSTKRYFN